MCTLQPRGRASPRDKNFSLLAHFGWDFLGAACRLEVRSRLARCRTAWLGRRHPLQQLTLLLSDDQSLCQFRTGSHTFYRLVVASRDSNHPTRARKLHLQVGVVRDCHELGQGGSAKQRMIGAVKVYHLELDWFAMMIVLLAEQNFQLDLPHWRARMSRCNPMKG
jgi:hypothetical protein